MAYTFPEGYPDYFDEKGCVQTDYLVKIPEDLADVFGTERIEGSDRRLTMNQLRGFFSHAKRAEDGLRRKLLPACDAINQIKKLESLARDRFGSGRIPETFYVFLRKNARHVAANDGGRSMKAFIQHFEALVGFCAGRLNERDSN
jgi:hypothetical protein